MCVCLCVAAGAAYSFGNGDFTGTVWWGRGWFGGSPRVLQPLRIKELADARVAQLDAGTAHTILRTQCGELFTFGNGSQGQLVRARQRIHTRAFSAFFA